MYAEEEIRGNEMPLHLNGHFMKNGHLLKIWIATTLIHLHDFLDDTFKKNV